MTDSAIKRLLILDAVFLIDQALGKLETLSDEVNVTTHLALNLKIGKLADLASQLERMRDKL